MLSPFWCLGGYEVFRVKSKEGNIYRNLKTERQRDYFISLGYTEVKEEKKPQNKNSKKGVKT